MRLRLTVLLVCVAGTLFAAAPAQTVIGGTPDVAHPYVGLVESSLGLCSGSLVTSTKFVTAAHCFAGDGEVVAVRFGQQVARATPFVLGVASVHPGFAPSNGVTGMATHDLAVVHLSTPVPMPRYAALPAAGAADALGRRAPVTIVGYGVFTFVRGVGPPIPFSNFTRRVGETIANNDNRSTSDTHLWLAPAANDTCFGDSGGPALVPDTDVILAVTSFGTSSMCKGGYSYRLDTAPALAFLASQGL